MEKPSTCCKCGSYKCKVPMPLNGRVQGIDFCIADIVASLNASNIKTLASCCGHGTREASIALTDGREIYIRQFEEQNHHTKTDDEILLELAKERESENTVHIDISCLVSEG